MDESPAHWWNYSICLDIRYRCLHALRFIIFSQPLALHRQISVCSSRRNVDDFKWLRSEASPHWSVLDEAERIKPELWKDVVPGGPQLGTEEILKALKIPVLNAK